MLGSKSSSGPPAVWTATSGTTDIPLGGDWTHSSWHMSRDGNCVTGRINSAAEEKSVGYIWQRDSKVTMFTGSEGNWAYPAAVANTGRVIGQTGNGGMPAEYWDASTNYEARLLSELVADLGYELEADYYLRQPQVITPNGKVIVGYGSCPDTGNWRYKITLNE